MTTTAIGASRVASERRSGSEFVQSNECEREARRTLTMPADPSPLLLAVIGLGLAGEAGEVVELIKKHVGHGTVPAVGPFFLPRHPRPNADDSLDGAAPAPASLAEPE